MEHRIMLMMTLYVKKNDRLQKIISPEDGVIPEETVWIDLLDLSKEEENNVEKFLGINVPSRDEMHEIEVSSRLYQKDNAIFMTAILVIKSEILDPEIHVVTFIIVGNRLVTVRYADSIPFRSFITGVEKLPANRQTAHSLLIGLLDCIIDNIADILEGVGKDIDGLTRKIFHRRKHTIEETDYQEVLENLDGLSRKMFPKKNIYSKEKPDYQEVLEKVGCTDDIASKTHESLVTLSRMVSYLAQSQLVTIEGGAYVRLSTLAKDVSALSEHVNFLSNKVTFLLDATLGMINIEQTNIIKILSVAAVVFLPPTLIASYYGMNFVLMPELKWHYGYPMAVCLMVLSSYLPYKYFKRKKWF